MDLLKPEDVKYIVVHCSDTRPTQVVDAETIDFWHRGRGFECIGYHYVILSNGVIELGRDLVYKGAHAIGYNSNSIGVCYIGGRDEQGCYSDTRTYAQKVSLLYTFGLILRRFPNVSEIIGHNDISVKACPCFDARKAYSQFITNYKQSFNYV